MINKYTTHDIAQHIFTRIKESQNILIVCSRPVDPDSLSSGLTMSWWIEKHFHKNSKTIIFYTIPDKFKNYPYIEQIEATSPSKVEWEKYDLIILVDSSSWEMLLTDQYKEVIEKTGLGPFVLIDHHAESELHKDLRHNSLRLSDICTGKIIYDNFIKSSTESLSEDIATLLYYGLIDDARYFKNEAYEGMYLYAEDLIKQKARHNEVMNISVDIDSMKFLAWAIENTEYYEDIGLTVLCIDDEKDEELSKLFGRKWKIDSIHKYYQETFMRIIENYNYGIMLEKSKNKIVAGWRTRNFGNTISIKEIFQKAGAIEAGGHFGAGGGSFETSEINEVRDSIVDEIRKEVEGG